MVARVFFREYWGEGKREHLLAQAAPESAPYRELYPCPANRFTMRRSGAASDYTAWPTIRDLSGVPDWSGVLEMRKGALIADDRAMLEERMARYLDPVNTLADLRAAGNGMTENVARFDAEKARATILARGGREAGRFTRIALYPFDVRWCFHTNVRPLWNEPRPEVAAQQAAGNTFLVTRAKARQPHEGLPCTATPALPGYHLLDPNAHPIPFVLHEAGPPGGLDFGGTARPNLSPRALAWTASLGLPPNEETSRLVWCHALATTHAPAWLTGNAEAIREDWPRIPIPADADALRASAALGLRLTALLDPDTPVPGVTAGALDPALTTIAVPRTRTGKAKDWQLLSWGHRTEKGVMPGSGEVSLHSTASADAARPAILGSVALDVHMNGSSFWENVPESVWKTRVGGYQVLKKWLSYRDASIIGRPLEPSEVEHVQHTARRLAAIQLLGPALDEAYGACAAANAPLPPLPS